MSDYTSDSEFVNRINSMPLDELRDEVIRWRAIAKNRQASLATLKARDGRMWAKWGELADKSISDPYLANDVDCITSELGQAFKVLVDFAISKVQKE